MVETKIDGEMLSTSESNLTSSTEFLEKNKSFDFITSIVSQPKPGINPKLYKSQKRCWICRTNLKSSIIAKKNKKFGCKFCGEAVCKKCSNIKCYNKLKNKPQRICISCFNQEIELEIKKKLQKELKNSLYPFENEKPLIEIEKIGIDKEIQNSEQLILYKQKELEDKTDKIKYLLENPIDANIKLDFDKSEIQSLQKILNDSHEKLGSLEHKIVDNNLLINHLKDQSFEIDVVLKKLADELEGIKNRNDLENSKNKQLQSLEILKNQITSHRGLVSTLKYDIQKLQKKIGNEN